MGVGRLGRRGLQQAEKSDIGLEDFYIRKRAEWG